MQRYLQCRSERGGSLRRRCDQRRQIGDDDFLVGQKNSASAFLCFHGARKSEAGNNAQEGKNAENAELCQNIPPAPTLSILVPAYGRKKVRRLPSFRGLLKRVGQLD